MKKKKKNLSKILKNCGFWIGDVGNSFSLGANPGFLGPRQLYN